MLSHLWHQTMILVGVAVITPIIRLFECWDDYNLIYAEVHRDD